MSRFIKLISVSSMLVLMTATNSIAAPLDAGSFSPEVQEIEVKEIKGLDRPEAYEPPPDIGAPKRTRGGSGRYV